MSLPYKLKCSIPKPSTVSDCEIYLKRINSQADCFQSKVNDLTTQISSHQTEILRLQKLIDSSQNELKKVQKNLDQNMFDKKCIQKWYDELNKNNEAEQYLSYCKEFIQNHINQSNSKRVRNHPILCEKYPVSNYYIPRDAFEFLKMDPDLPTFSSDFDFQIPPNMREKRKNMTSSEKKADRKAMSQMWHNACAKQTAQEIFSVLTSDDIVKLAHYLHVCRMLDNPQDSHCDWIRFMTYASVLNQCDYHGDFDRNIVSDIYDCNGQDYEESRCCHKKYAYVLEDFKYITLKSSDVVMYTRL